MSIFHRQSGLASLNSKVTVNGDKVIVRTHGVWQALSLFSYRRQAVIDPVMKRIEVSVRRAWLWASTEIIPFEDIQYIHYKYSSLPTSWSWFHGATDTVESYKVQLALPDERMVTIAAFRGDGARMTGLGGMLLSGDSMFDISGDQEDSSLDFVNMLERMTGAKVGKPLLSAKAISSCESCGRASSPGQACLYCGGKVVTL